ncbi:hypothetical protein [Undibacterium sp.]|uniref:hypothetical protein n=1 Tax=Undibacterium sp. TaxID=1914977 RepID=UPI0037506A36
MLSDSCVELNNDIAQAANAAIDQFEELVESYDNGTYDYPVIVLQTLRLAISDFRGKRLGLIGFLQMIEMVQAFFDNPQNPVLEDLICRIEGVLGEKYWLRWQN